MTNETRPLAGKVALVAGGTRGGGRGIAIELGAAGATVYVTGRSSKAGRSDMDRPETIEETAQQITAAGGHGVPVRTDHSRPEDVRALVDRIAAEQGGQLDILVNSVGRRFADRLGASPMGAGPGHRAEAAAASGGDPCDHQPVRAAADGRPRERSGRGGH